MTGLGGTFELIRGSFGPLCVGIDPSADSLELWGLPDVADGALEFSRVVIESAAGRVGIVKPQVGYFERFGSAGFAALEQVIADAHAAGLTVIADAKRGDIGTTMEGYAAAWLGDGPLGCDAMTSSPYQGFDALEPAFDRAESTASTVFVLCATSNPDAPGIQGAQLGGRSLPSIVAERARERSGNDYTVGLVVGATRSLAESGLTESDLVETLILAPGFGAQGASLTDLSAIFGRASSWVIPSVSRSVVRGGPTGVDAAIDAHLRELGR